MSGITERLYLGSPVWAQQCAVASYGWWWYRRRFSPHFHRLVAEFKAQERWTIGQFRNYQEGQLNKVLEAARNSPYYRQVFTDARVNPAMKASDSLRRLPLLSKETLRTSARELLSQSPLPKGTISFKSSGTTGTPTEIFYTPEFHALESATLEARTLNWAGVDYRDRRVMFGVRKVCRFDQRKPPFWRFSPAENLAYASIYHLSPKFLRYYLEFLRSYRPEIVMGYPSALNTLACYALSNSDMPFPAKAIVTTSETVTADVRKRIETIFQCRIYDSYTAVELCVFASQCEYGRYHVSPEVGLLEIVDRMGEPVPPGVIGEVICTGLQNLLQPLIRYRVGDVARWAIDQNCRCRRQMPVLENIEGRFEDICYTPDGRELLRFDTVFKGVENIREAQVVQEKIDLFTVHVVPTNGFSERDIETIKHNMQLHVGNVHTEVKAVDAVARTASGKFRAVICNLPREEKILVGQTWSDDTRPLRTQI